MPLSKPEAALVLGLDFSGRTGIFDDLRGHAGPALKDDTSSFIALVLRAAFPASYEEPSWCSPLLSRLNTNIEEAAQHESFLTSSAFDACFVSTGEAAAQLSWP